MSASDLPIAWITVDGATYPVAVPNHETDYIQGNLMRTGKPYEEGMLEWMAALLNPGDLVLDIGANIGNHTLYLAHVVGCSVIAFEPNGQLVEALRHSVEIGGVGKDVCVRSTALGRSPHRGRLHHVDEANLGGFQVIDDESGEITVVPLDDLGLTSPVAAMKVDVEGMELEVLDGAVATITRDRPHLFVEAMDKPRFDHIAAWMLDHDYVYQATFNATPTHAFRPAKPAERDLGAILMGVVRQRYDADKERADLRRSLAQEAAQRRALAEQLAAVRARAKARRSAARRQAQKLADAKARVARLEREVAKLRNRKVVRAADALGRLRRRTS